MILWDIRERLRKQGWENPNHLAIGAGLTYPVARRVWQAVENEERIDRLDSVTLEKLRVALGVKSPFTLLRYVPEPRRRPSSP